MSEADLRTEDRPGMVLDLTGTLVPPFWGLRLRQKCSLMFLCLIVRILGAVSHLLKLKGQTDS